jgi:carboxypeptidase family protein
MWKRLKKRLIWSTVILCVVPRVVLPSQEEAKTPKKPQLIEVQIKVTDKKDGSAIDNADVLVKWGEGEESDSGSAITNSKGIAKVKDVPRGSVVIRVIANGYKTAAPKIDLKKEGQPIKIELEKETQDECPSALMGAYPPDHSAHKRIASF